MSHSSPATSSSFLTNIIYTTSQIPLCRMMGNFMTKTAATFEYASSLNPESRFTAAVIATMMTAGGIWGFQFTLGRIPFHFVRKTLIPVAECSLKAGLAWVIFKALDAAVLEVNKTLPDRDKDEMSSGTRQDPFHKTPKRY